MWIALCLALALCAGAGLFLGAWKAAQTPAFYVAVVRLVIDAVLPEIAKRMTPEKERELKACIDAGKRWDPIKQRCVDLW